MQSKKQLLAAIRKGTKPPKGFSQWVLILEHRKLSDSVGLMVVEAQLNGKPEWSGSFSANLPEKPKFGPDGAELPGEWSDLKSGQSRYNVLTFEIRGKDRAFVELKG